MTRTDLDPLHSVLMERGDDGQILAVSDLLHLVKTFAEMGVPRDEVAEALGLYSDDPTTHGVARRYLDALAEHAGVELYA